MRRLNLCLKEFTLKGSILLFFDSKDKPTSFEVDFIYEDIEYIYGYSLKDNVFGQECLYEFKGSEYQIIFEHDTVSKVLNVCDEMKETIDILNRVNEKKFLEQFMVDYFDCIQVNKVKRWGVCFEMQSYGRYYRTFK